MSVEVFRPAWWLPGAHLQTAFPSFWPAPRPGSPSETIDVPVATETSVRLAVDRPAGGAGGTLLLLHGLGGSADAPYMLRTQAAAARRGWTVARMNLRNCGGTEALSRTLYNAGQSEDAGRVLEALEGLGFPRPYAAVGFSLGGNLLLRYAGLSAADCVADAVVGVNPPVDLSLCIDALERPANRPYHLYFRHRLITQVRAIRKLRSVPGPPATWATIRGVREFDDLFTAPDAGDLGADAYYRRASAGPHLPAIRRPALVLSAEDDPFVPVVMFAPWRDRAPGVRFVHPPAGGHCGYWRSRPPRYWAAETALDFLDATVRRAGGVPFR